LNTTGGDGNSTSGFLLIVLLDVSLGDTIGEAFAGSSSFTFFASFGDSGDCGDATTSFRFFASLGELLGEGFGETPVCFPSFSGAVHIAGDDRGDLAGFSPSAFSASAGFLLLNTLTGEVSCSVAVAAPCLLGCCLFSLSSM